MRLRLGITVFCLFVAPSVHAASLTVPSTAFPMPDLHAPPSVSGPVCEAPGSTTRTWAFIGSDAAPDQQPDAQPLHAAAVEHSDAYETRAKIHKVASLATLPLFAAEVVLGQVLYGPSASVGATRTAHVVVGTGIMALFGVNTITGAWNLFGESWHDPNGRGRRLLHGFLMMTADAGFVATTASGPGGSRREPLTFTMRESTHRAIALSSIGVATTGYLLMLLGNH